MDSLSIILIRIIDSTQQFEISVGITQDDKQRLYPLPVEKIWGIGSRIKLRLNIMNILTIGDLAKAYLPAVKKEFGINGVVYYKMSRGEDTSEIYHKSTHEKSLMHQHSMDNEIFKPEEVLNEIRRIGEYLCRKLRSKKLTAKQLVLFLRYDNLEYRSADGKLSQATNDDREIFEAAKKLFKRIPHPTKSRKARAFAMAVFDLDEDTNRRNLNLFEKNTLFPYYSLDKIKSKFGENIIRVGLTA